MQDISSLNVVDLLLDAVCMVRADSELVFASAAFERIFGYRPSEALGKRMLDLVHPDDVDATREQARRVSEGNLQLQFENRYVRKDGKIVHVRWTARWLPEHQVRLAVAHDITERKRTEFIHMAVLAISEAAHAAESLAALLLRIHEIIGGLMPSSYFAVALHDAASGQLAFPYAAGDAACAAEPSRDTLCAEVIGSARAVLRKGACGGTCPPSPSGPADGLAHDDGNHCWLGVPLVTSRGAMGALVLHSPAGTAGYDARDLQMLQLLSTQVAAAVERTQMLGRLEHLARYDQLTHLPNRQLFMDRLGVALDRARESRHLLSLLFIDLDRFKSINDTHGHAMGDLLLQRVAQRLLECVRSTDTLARLGGDEFVVLLESGHAREQSTVVAHKILTAFGQPFDLEGVSVTVQPSIGVAFFPDHGTDEHRLLGRADSAMYLSKKAGGNRVQVATVPLSA